MLASVDEAALTNILFQPKPTGPSQYSRSIAYVIEALFDQHPPSGNCNPNFRP